MLTFVQSSKGLSHNHHHGLEATLSTDRQENAMTRALEEASPYFGGTLRTGQKENAMKGTLGPKSQFQGCLPMFSFCGLTATCTGIHMASDGRPQETKSKQ